MRILKVHARISLGEKPPITIFPSAAEKEEITRNKTLYRQAMAETAAQFWPDADRIVVDTEWEYDVRDWWYICLIDKYGEEIEALVLPKSTEMAVYKRFVDSTYKRKLSEIGDDGSRGWG